MNFYIKVLCIIAFYILTNCSAPQINQEKIVYNQQIDETRLIMKFYPQKMTTHLIIRKKDKTKDMKAFYGFPFEFCKELTVYRKTNKIFIGIGFGASIGYELYIFVLGKEKLNLIFHDRKNLFNNVSIHSNKMLFFQKDKLVFIEENGSIKYIP